MTAGNGLHPPPHATPEANAVATALEHHRLACARALFDTVSRWDKYAAEIRAFGEPIERYIELHFYVFVDCLALYFRTGDRVYRDLYLGEMIQLLTWPGDPDETARRERVRGVMLAGAAGVGATVRADLSPAAQTLLETELDDLRRIMTTQTRVSLTVLMVGDCLYRDIMSFVVAPALEDEITIVPTFLTSKNPPDLRNELGKLRDRPFDVVFFSPFTYELSPEYTRTHHARFALARPSAIRSLVDAAFDSASKTLDLLSELFECPIFVHNSANVRRHDGRLAQRLKNAVTWRARSRARAIVNERLAKHVAARNAETYRHVFIVDETRWLSAAGEHALGKTFYDSDEQHPAALGKYLARDYGDILAVHAHLSKKKVIVCDLDNTLWSGVIGEGGAVVHYEAKQRALKRLKEKGVVLAINSKNDPKNVHWRGAVLSEDDFVCTQINWETKVSNMKRIEEELNLKSKDFVFLDDRADERDMMRTAHPGVCTMDALDARTWRLVELWADVMPSDGEDRTQFYKQREKRQEFLEAGGKEDPGALFGQLGLEVTIREAEKRDLKRVAELINRTNQFNTCGSRTTLREIVAWHESGSRKILVVDAGDKFGSMGTISIAIVHEQSDKVEIPVFVLSCRVFGYRIEDVVVNTVKRYAARASLPIRGHYKETPHNEPCRKVYADNGFEWDGSAWVFASHPRAPVADPTWLRVRSELSV